MNEEKNKPCGCCEDTKPATPLSTVNPAGLEALTYRIGTHGSFKASMIHALSRSNALRDLTVRNDNDPTIAFIDAWATVLDVLTFYQERIINEGYLNTATERRSILELARSIGYELKPGIAAGTYLAFTVEDAPGAPDTVRVPVGTKAQSVPGQDEEPQIFETVEEIEARAEWNDIKTLTKRNVNPASGNTLLYIQGTSSNIKTGDMLLFVNPGSSGTIESRSTHRTVTQVKTEPLYNRTKISLSKALDKSYSEVHILRQRTSLFGHNAPDWLAMPEEIRMQYGGTGYGSLTQWPNFNVTYSSGTGAISNLHLDTVYPQITPDAFVIITAGSDSQINIVDEVTETSKTNFTLTSKVSKIKLKNNVKTGFRNKLREIVVYAKSEKLDLAETPIHEDVQDNTVITDGTINGLDENRLLLICGADAITGEQRCEIARLHSAKKISGENHITLKENLQYRYEIESVSINANVARATHGEIKDETVGSGDSSIPHQKFTLKHSPLTYLSVPTPSGGESTLELRVNDILWSEVPSLYPARESDRVYTTRIDDDGNITVSFGDGKKGRRPQSGTENITARYRKGAGLQGHLKKDKLSLLMAPPPGLKSVINPLPSSGGDDPEERDDARRNAPFTVLTMDRIVSVQDFEDFARAYPGIGKARADKLWNGKRDIVHISIAAADGKEISDSSDLYENLKNAIDTARHAAQQVILSSFILREFNISAKIFIHKNYLDERVLDESRKKLVSEFSFHSRQFGQSVTASEIHSLLHHIPGISGVDIDELYFTGETPEPRNRLPAHTAWWNDEKKESMPAELLLIFANGIELIPVKE